MIEHGEQATESLRIAVSGGGGYVGSVLVPFLLRRGHHVRVLDRFFFGQATLEQAQPFGAACELVKVDNRAVTREHFANMDVAIDLAGLSNDPSCALDESLTHAINVDGGTKTLNAAREAGVRRYIYQSSCSVYGAGGSKLLNESSPLAPVSAYARSKIEMERRVREAGGPSFEPVLPRVSTIFGASPRMRFDLIVNSMTFKGFREGRIFVLGGGQQWRPLIHTTDVARALYHFAEAPASRLRDVVFNVGQTEHNYQTDQVARLVAKVVPHVEIIRVPDDVDKRSYRVDFSRYLDLFGPMKTVSVQEGAQEVYRDLVDGVYDEGIRSSTVGFYKYLIDAKQVLDDVTLDGRLL